MKRRRCTLLPAVPCVGAAILILALTAGCDSRKPATSPTRSEAAVAVDAEAQAVASLESQQDAGQCRTVLQQLDNLESAASRPVLSASEAAELSGFLRLTAPEAAEAAQPTFSQTDAAYLEECLLIRAGVRSLRVDGLPPLQQAQQLFDWVCRLVYVDDRVSWPANPWTTLQAGSGLVPARAYVTLAAWQQAGLDACLVGPPALKDAPSHAPSPMKSGATAYAPIRACGVKIDKDVYLFDPAAGRALPGPNGKGVLTLSQARAEPGLVTGVGPAGEAASWQVFLAPPLPALSRRMDWLQRMNPGGTGPVLFVDVSARRANYAADLPGVPCESWNPPGDSHSATRVLARYSQEDGTSRQSVALRDKHKVLMAPLEHLPRTTLRGNALAHLSMSFARPFEALRYAPNTPRDLLIRGQFQQATSVLEDTKRNVDNARARMEQDANLRSDFDKWADDFQSLFASVIRAEQSGDALGMASASRAMEAFRAQPKNRDVERAFTYGSAAPALGAEVMYLMAECVHERAERLQRDDPKRAASQWRNAAEWWERFLEASAQARSPYPAREPHARALLDRCRQVAQGKGA